MKPLDNEITSDTVAIPASCAKHSEQSAVDFLKHRVQHLYISGDEVRDRQNQLQAAHRSPSNDHEVIQRYLTAMGDNEITAPITTNDTLSCNFLKVSGGRRFNNPAQTHLCPECRHDSNAMMSVQVDFTRFADDFGQESSQRSRVSPSLC